MAKKRKRTLSGEERKQDIKDNWIKINDRFYMIQDNFCWRLYDFGARDSEDERYSLIGQRQTYHPNIRQVCYHLLNRIHVESTSLSEIHALYGDAEQLLTEKVEAHATNVETERLLETIVATLTQHQENTESPSTELRGLLELICEYKERYL